MTNNDFLERIQALAKGISTPSRNALLVSAKMLSEGMDIPSNLDYFRERLIGTEAEKDIQIETALQAYGQRSKLA
ncbi:hypothetical protein [Gilvimarinus agarilyticus]|uniref:hypothetical protein n=1 Tax=Gilvimarinus agarilyticus TaxID=679259 RepID=UPI0005A182B2|nr:hypothetical protein [Gilvimarinus agarilyticus]